MKTINLILALFFLSVILVKGQDINQQSKSESNEKILSDDKDVNEERLAQISLLPYIGTNGKRSDEITNHFSFNIISGYSSGVKGVELGSLININKNDVIGFQMSGLVNSTGGKTSGVQLAGLVNYNKKEINGFQMSGLSNITDDTLKGVQLAGLFNYARINKGFQFALLNLADTSTGVSLGLMSFVKKGYYDIKVFADEMRMGNLFYNMGTQRFYNIFGLSANDKSWCFSYGFGTYLYKGNKLNVNSDLIFSQLNYKKFFETDNSIKTKLSLDFNIKILKNLSVFPQLSFNMYETDKLNGGYLREYVNGITLTKINEYNFKSVIIQYWPGFSLGLKYKF